MRFWLERRRSTSCFGHHFRNSGLGLEHFKVAMSRSNSGSPVSGRYRHGTSPALQVRLNAAKEALKGVENAFARIGAFDHLVLALGSGKGFGPFASMKLADVRQGFEEKVYPHFACAQAAIPFLHKGGSVTFVSAVSAHAAMPGTAGIGAANAAVAALVPILAAELRPLRVNGVSPGVIDTPWWDFLSKDQKTPIFADYASKTPVARVGQPDDVAQAIAFLISDTFMSGHVMIWDGGLRLVG
jgi:NAD(P)-dependent dehydrogenase (short-subunit alcohol dehydrogenase family)